jgi:predicted GNAT family N-acyltransferase
MSEPFTVRRVVDDADWRASHDIRRRVFIEEQHCPPELEWDEHDEPGARGTTCIHMLGLIGRMPLATARWREVSLAGEPAAKMERFAILPLHRGQGLGRRLVDATMEDARAAGLSRFTLHAQSHLVPFYRDFGFHVTGAPFYEAGIEHVKMVLTAG